MKMKMKDIMTDLVENLKGYKQRIKDLSEDYYNYDRNNFIYRYFVGGELDRERDGEDIYNTDIQTLTVQLIQMYLEGQILYENRDTNKMIDRINIVKGNNTLNENMINTNIDDKKVIQSFVWYCFGKLKEDTIRNFITSYREDMTEYFRNKMSNKLDVESSDEDMNIHNKQSIEKDLENQKQKIDTTLLQFTDELGFSKNVGRKC